MSLAIVGGCTKKSEEEGEAAAASCSSVAMTAAAWVPSVADASNGNHDSNVSIIKSTHLATGPLTGIEQPAPSSREITITFEVNDDPGNGGANSLGTNGSITLVAETTAMPSGYSGSAFPVLVSLDDGTNELVNLDRGGDGGSCDGTVGGGDCAKCGYFECSSSSCTSNLGCSIGATSAFDNRRHWDQHQVPAFGNASTNMFPTCNWAGCDFNATFFSGGALRSGAGVTYTAKYVLIADEYLNVGSSPQASMKLTVLRKKDTSAVAATNNGAVDINVILVGAATIADSQTVLGGRNLNTLLDKVSDHYSASGTGVRLGAITAYDWPCELYAMPSLTEISSLFREGSAKVDSSSEGKAINLFLVTSISTGQYLGVAGAIRGPLVNGTEASGVVVAVNNKLDSYNPTCSTNPCAQGTLDEEYVDLASTISHEVGHFIGLNHLNESDGSLADFIPNADTPVCGTLGGSVTHASCLMGAGCGAGCTADNGSAYSTASGEFCPGASACQFNHVMWWTTKNYSESTLQGDGNIFSTFSSRLLNYSPLVQ